jgi:putative FmdB family regulatory protein
LRCKLPIYEYECNSCHTRFERRQGFHEEPVAMCPACNSKSRRVIHSVPVLFKGSGFYCTDHGRGSSGPAGRKEEALEPKPDVDSKADTDTGGKATETADV